MIRFVFLINKIKNNFRGIPLSEMKLMVNLSKFLLRLLFQSNRYAFAKIN
jgi:hypothetical protein